MVICFQNFPKTSLDHVAWLLFIYLLLLLLFSQIAKLQILATKINKSLICDIRPHR
jgi:hypothetical protein